LRDVDVIVWVYDVTEPVGGGVHYILDLLAKVESPVILALNKIDRLAKQKLLPIIASFAAKRPFHAIVPISALAGDGDAALEQEIVAALPVGEPLYPADYLTDQAERTYAAEIVREKLLHHLREELPYTTAVLVDRFEEAGDDGLMKIACVILVEAASQKGIVLGKGGDMIKRIGTEARLELEQFFDTRLFLDLHVKVRGEWRNDERILDEMGLGKRGR
jgi:GTP-binding protein Era